MNIETMGALGDTAGIFYPARWNAEWICWVATQWLFEGTMRGLFTALFGAGMLLMLRRAEGAEPQVAPFDVWSRRCLALMALGIVQCVVFFWPGEILWTYGLAGFALLAFRLARARTLLIAAAIVLVSLSGWNAYSIGKRTATLLPTAAAAAAKKAGHKLTEAQQTALDAAQKIRDSYHPTNADLAKDYQQRTRLPGLLAWSWDKWSAWHLGTTSWLSTAEQIGFMLIGMALFRAGVLTGDASAATYRRLLVGGYGIGLLIRAVSLYLQSRRGFDFDPNHISILRSAGFTFFYEPARLAITLGHVGLIVTLFRSGALGRAWPLRALGRMALTTYSLQSILTSVFFYAMGWLGWLHYGGLVLACVAVWLMTGLFAVAWLRGHDMGPAEAALRTIAYGRFRRRPAVAAALAAVPAL